MNIRRFVIGSALAFACLTGCGGPLNLQVKGTPLSPGSDALVVAEIDESHHMTKLEITATNLTPPGRLSPDGKVYVVWSRASSKAQWQRVGGLTFDEASRKGELKTSTAETAFDLIITIEAAPDATSPSTKVMFEQRVEKS